MRRFCKEPKTFPQDILLILSPSVSACRLLLRSNLLSLLLSELSPPNLPHLLNPAALSFLRPLRADGRASRFPALAASTYYLSVPVRCVPTIYLACYQRCRDRRKKNAGARRALKGDVGRYKYNRKMSDKYYLRVLVRSSDNEGKSVVRFCRIAAEINLRDPSRPFLPPSLSSCREREIFFL